MRTGHDKRPIFDKATLRFWGAAMPGPRRILRRGRARLMVEKRGDMMNKTSLERRAKFLALLLVATLLGVLPGPAIANGLRVPDGGEPGPFAVGHTSFVLEQATGRRVAVDVWYPSDGRDVGPGTPQAVYSMDPYFDALPDTTSEDWEARGYDRAYQESRPSKRGPFPLVVYSSGFSFPAWANLFLATRLASHGYILAVIQHLGDWAFPSWHPPDDFYTIAFNRPRDMSFALTELLAKNRRHGDLLHRLIDSRHVVAAGHSFGGFAALVATGGDDTACDAKDLYLGDPPPPGVCGPTPIDPRFSAVFVLEPSTQEMRFEELERVAVPSLVMGGSVERQSPVLDEWRSWIARTHAGIGRRDAFRVDLQDTDHFSYSNYCDGVTMLHDRGAISEDDWNNWYGVYFCGAPLPVAEGHRLVDKFVVAFLDTYVGPRRDGRSGFALGGAAAHEPLAELFRSERCHADVADPDTLFTYRPHRGTCEVAVKNPASWF